MPTNSPTNIGNTGTILSFDTGVRIDFVGSKGFTGTIGNGGKITATDGVSEFPSKKPGTLGQDWKMPQSVAFE